ncbi:ATP-binding protein [Leptolyngbya sp. FACHB-541]|uniref:ATP-binding protein n=1 Tax=Leptolyngbya sp. FACHB-541 TaxID=2692810 RepID=UPI0016823816|nr:ATP-binding protein [Leptolyngbya sp. FACHB-541]MBD1998443.1 ATP-binding protein [Leptolyngbya sp. FACHB-541]
MVQSNAVPQPGNEARQAAIEPQTIAVPQPAPVRPFAEPDRSPEVQQEVDRVRSSDTYRHVSRDVALFSWLNSQRDSRSNGYIVGANFADLRKACQFYRLQYVRRKGVLYTIPMPIAYAEVEQHGSPIDLFIAILESLGSPFAEIGPLKDIRSRTLGTLKSFGVKILIVGNADCLSYESYNELVRLTWKLKIPVILAGSLYLSEIFSNFLKRRGKRYRDIYNNFLDFHEYQSFQKGEIQQLVASWENQVLNSWTQKLDLISIAGVPDFLHHRCEGQAEPLYEILRKIAVFKLDNPSYQFNKANIEKMLSSRMIPNRS